MESKILRFGKIILISAGLLFMGLMGGCAVNNENTTAESNNDVISDELENSKEEEKHFWVNRQGEIFDGINAPGGVDESLDTLVWMAFRGGTVISEDMSAEENAFIPESDRVLEGSEEAEDHVWIRIVQEPFTASEGSLGQVSHKDYIFYVQGEDAYVGVQSAEDTELWTILEMADYGDWLEKELDIYVRMTTGL